MTDPVGASSDQDVVVEGFPSELSPNATILVTGSVDPARYGIGLRALCRYGSVGDSGLVVTTTDSADQTRRSFENVCEKSEELPLGIVDTTSQHQYVNQLYGVHPTVHIPTPGDLEKLVVALSDLGRNSSLPDGTHHLVVRSLTPILEGASTAHVFAVLDRLSQCRTKGGHCFLGVTSVEHDAKLIDELVERVDGVLSVTKAPENRVKVALHTRDSYLHSSKRGER